MVFFLLSFFSFSWKCVGLDLGSQFFKLAESTSDGNSIIFTDPRTSSIRIPSSAAFRFLDSKSFPLTEEDFESIEVRFGFEALSLLARNESFGYEFLPRTIARNHTKEFHTGKGVQEIELFLLSLHNVFRLIQPFNIISIALPSFFTRRQISMVLDAVKAFELPLASLMSDIQAIATWYTIVRSTIFVNTPKHILFIDIGSTATKIYSLRLSYEKVGEKEFVIANQTSGGWTEKVGGYHLAKAIAKKNSISFKKAQKILVRKGGLEYEELFEEQMEILEDLIHEVIDKAITVVPIDEIEVIGGSSRFKFVMETIQDVTNLTIRKDLNPTESIALGVVATILSLENRSPKVPVILRRLPPTSMNINCGDRSSVYCKKGEMCFDIVQFLNVESVCTEFSIVADPTTIPEGANPLLLTLALTKPINLISPNNNYTIKFRFDKPDAVITKMEVCISDEECEEEEFEPINEYNEESDRAFFFLSNYMNGRSLRELKRFVKTSLEMLNEVRIERENENQEPELTEEMKDYLDELKEQNESDGFKETSIPELVDIMKRLHGIAMRLGIELTPPSTL
jgi:hypothetical protein